MYPYRLISCVVYTVTYGDGHLDLKPRQDQLNIYNVKYREDEIRVDKEEKKEENGSEREPNHEQVARGAGEGLCKQVKIL